MPFPKNDPFHTTRWSIVVSAGSKSTAARRDALEWLCQQYWYPLYVYARRRVANVQEAGDVTQSFFVELLEKDYLKTATPERGRFRAFLITAFRHFLSKEWEKAKAQKRGGTVETIPLDLARGESRFQLEPVTTLTPEQEYMQQWAVALLERVLQRLEVEHDSQKRFQFQALKGFLTGDNPNATYADVAVRLETSEAAIKMKVHRLRQKYSELLRAEIANTVQCGEDVDDEIRELFGILDSQ